MSSISQRSSARRTLSDFGEVFAGYFEEPEGESQTFDLQGCYEYTYDKKWSRASGSEQGMSYCGLEEDMIQLRVDPFTCFKTIKWTKNELLSIHEQLNVDIPYYNGVCFPVCYKHCFEWHLIIHINI